MKERERETLREKFNFMRGLITKNGEITETEFILEIDEHGIGLATYNKIKTTFRDNSLKAGIHYDSKLKIYHHGIRQDTLDTIPIKEKEKLI